MVAIILVLSAIPVIIPFINTFYLAVTLNRLYSDKKFIKILDDYGNQIMKDGFGWKKLTGWSVERTLNTDLYYKRYTSSVRKEFIHSYKKLDRTIRGFLLSAVTTALIWFISLLLSLYYYRLIPLDFILVLLLFGFGITWVMQIAPVLRFLRLWGTFPEKINELAYNIIGSNGMLSKTMPKIAVRIALLVVNAFVFAVYLPKALDFMDLHISVPPFLELIIVLCLYQYIICRIVALITCCVLKKMRKKQNAPIQSFEYYYATIKNNTYFLFLLLFIIVKSIQVDGWDTYGRNMAEAIGILFLLDTYFQQNRDIERIEKENTLSGR